MATDISIKAVLSLVHDKPEPVPSRLCIHMSETYGPHEGCAEFQKEPDIWHCNNPLSEDSWSHYCDLHKEFDEDKNRYPIQSPPNLWEFNSTDEAYMQTQVRDDIKDGDILVIRSEKVVGFLMQAWPTAVTTSKGQFHGLRASSYDKVAAQYPRTFTNLAVLVKSLKW